MNLYCDKCKHFIGVLIGINKQGEYPLGYVTMLSHNCKELEK